MSTPTQSGAPKESRSWRNILLIAGALLILGIIIPPLFNISRFDRTISTGISSSIGRPVHISHASLRLLPTPALTLENFTVAEDPAFGNEPVIRAASVTATLRLASLWLRHIEVSSISLDEPSINLTRNGAGLWNFQGILLQAASVPTTPTDDPTPAIAITHHDDHPHFPYIQATHARINIILGNEKIPLNFADSDLGIWQASDGRWRLRIRTTPSRSDMNLSDTGLVHIDGSAGWPTPKPGDAPHDSAWSAVPLDLQLRWDPIPLGELSRLFTSYDQPARGYFQTRSTITGSIGNAHLHTVLSIDHLRADNVVPDSPLSLALTCDTDVLANFQHLDHIACALPLAGGSPAPTLQLTGSVGTLRNIDPAALFNPTTADPNLTLTSTNLDASTLLFIARHFTTRLPASLAISGPVITNFVLSSTPAPDNTKSARKKSTTPATPIVPMWTGSMRAENLLLTLPTSGTTGLFSTAAANEPIPLHAVTLTTETAKPTAHTKAAPPSTDDALNLSPISIPLGATTPATFTAKFSATSYTLHLTGNATPARLDAFTASIPWLIPQPTPESPAPTKPAMPTAPALPAHIDLTTTQPWQ